MKLNIEQKTLAATLKRLSSIVETRNTIPILANVALTAADGALTLTVTDLDIQATATIAATVEADGACTVGAKMLADIVSKLPSGALVTLDCAQDKIKVSAGRSKFELSTLPIEDFPQLASETFAASFDIAADDLAALFGAVFAASSEETRYYLNGVYLHQIDGQTVAVATDGHRLAHVSRNVSCPDCPGVIVPRKTVLEAAKSLADGQVTVSVSDTKIRFQADHFTLLSKVIDGTFPDYTRVIPAANKGKATFDADDMRTVIDRVVVVSSEKTRAVKLSIAQDWIEVSNRSPQSSASDGVTAGIDGADVEIGFNGAYFSEALRQMSGLVTMQYSGPGDPVILSAGAGAKYIVMPMRV